MAGVNLSRLPEPTTVFTDTERSYINQLLKVIRLNEEALLRLSAVSTSSSSDFLCNLDGGTPDGEYCGGVDLGTFDDPSTSYIFFDAGGP